MNVMADRPQLPPIEELNRLEPEAFARGLKPLFEAAGPLASLLYAQRPYRSYDGLLKRAGQLVHELPESEQIEVVNAHPRIGASAEALRRESLLSYREQGYDREFEIDQAEIQRVLRELEACNQAYEETFGFRFVVFVNRRPRSEILEVLKARLRNPRDAELATALHDMLAIARDRLSALRATLPDR